MADHIPFLLGSTFKFATSVYPDADVFRVELKALDEGQMQGDLRAWVDAAIDGLHSLHDRTDQWKRYMDQFPHYRQIASVQFQAKPNKEVVSEFAFSVLGACRKHHPQWITIPQLPMIDGAGRNKINRMLADATGRWKIESRFRGKLILPLIFTHQNQVNLKVPRNQIITLAKNCYERAGADGVWAVDCTLSDLDGSPTFQRIRFPGLISFHEELRREMPQKAIVVAGPYWGLNLVLWARGLVDHPAIGVGRGYRYFLSGGQTRLAAARAALPPLRRTALVSDELAAWVTSCLDTLSPDDQVHAELAHLLRNLPQLHDLTTTTRNTARFYKQWYDRIAASPMEGRSLALYQDFSSAYVLGRTLPDLPSAEKTARRPERPAEQFMLLCL